MSTANKHAYLIITHGNPFVLEKLILLLDDVRNDIYIHIDKKIVDFNFKHFQNLPQKSQLFFTPRIDVRWGHVSLVEAELTLFEEALSKYEYAHYHLLSGADLPLKSQDEMHSFFEKHKGKEFLGFSDDAFDTNRVSKIHLFPKNMRVLEQQYLLRIGRRLRNAFLLLQERVGYNYHRDFQGELKFGTQWASLTHSFVKELVEQKGDFLDFYKYSNCSDEIYKQTFAYNSKFKNSIHCLGNELKSCQRFMDWKRGRPYTFRKEDFQLLIESDMLFARKFEDTVDKEIVELVFEKIKG